MAKASSPCSNAQYRTLAESGALNEKLFPYPGTPSLSRLSLVGKAPSLSKPWDALLQMPSPRGGEQNAGTEQPPPSLPEKERETFLGREASEPPRPLQ